MKGAASVLSPLARFLLPEAASAALTTGTTSGRTSKYSPFGAADTRLVVSKVTTDPTTVEGSGTVTETIRVRTHNGTPVDAVPFKFTPSTGSTASPTEGLTGTHEIPHTDPSGEASTDWSFTTPGSYTLQADVFPAVHHGDIGATSVTFSATVTSSVGTIGYLSTGYRYLLSTGFEGTYPPADFMTTGFDDSGWAQGNAGFGHDGGDGCPLNTPTFTKTDWPGGTGEAPSYIIIRKQFTVDGSTAVVSVAIDNDIRVWVDGTEITSTGGTPDGTGFVQHEGCPSRGSLAFTASNLGAGPHLLVVEGKDRGGSSYLDVSVDPLVIH
jgi:hypothetical protein